MRILILSDCFAAPSYKPRLRILCDYLHQQGHTVHLICEQFDPLSFDHDYPITEVALYKKGVLDWTIKNIGTMLFQWKERAFERKVTRLIKNESFDIVFCTTFHTFPLRTANNIAAKLHIPCVLDLRDMTEQAPINDTLYLAHQSALLRPFAKLYVRQNIKRRNRELHRANVITTVSPWHTALVNSILGSDTRTAVYTVYNGYDKNRFQPANIPSDTFRIAYTGKVFPLPQQDPTLLFEALKKLPYTPDELAVDWYIDEQSENLIRSMAQQAGVAPYMHYKGIVRHQRIPDILQESSVCLVLTNTAGDESGHGKMTTKFFEALGVEKPVLCVTSDEECLAQVIRETKAGCAATNADQVVDFLQACYHEWQANGYTRQAVDATQKDRFARQTQAVLWEQILQEQTDHFKHLG